LLLIRLSGSLRLRLWLCCARLWLRLRLWLCCARLWLRAGRFHPTLRFTSHWHVLSRTRSWRLRNLRLRHILAALRFTRLWNILPRTWRNRLFAPSYHFSLRVLDSVALRALLIDLLLPLLLCCSTLGLFPTYVCLALLLLQLLQLSPRISITLCRFGR
jgi:hypothetical protein